MKWERKFAYLPKRVVANPFDFGMEMGVEKPLRWVWLRGYDEFRVVTFSRWGEREVEIHRKMPYNPPRGVELFDVYLLRRLPKDKLAELDLHESILKELEVGEELSFTSTTENNETETRPNSTESQV